MRKMPGKLQLDGVSVPITTPFDASGSLDLDGLKKNIALYNRNPLTSYVCGGSTGESAFLGKDEKLKTWEAVRESAAAGRQLLAGAAYESVYQTVKMVNAAAEIGFDAALLLAPHYYRALMDKPEPQLAYYRGVADAAKIPVVIYNFPQITGVDIAAETVAKLADHPNIIGIKESSAEITKVAALMQHVPADFQVTMGNARKYFDGLELGIRGGIMAVADIVPAETLEIHRLYRAGDVAGAKAQQERLGEACNIPYTFGIPGIKYAMDRKGFVGGGCRLPLLPIGAEGKSSIEATLARLEAHAAATV